MAYHTKPIKTEYAANVIRLNVLKDIYKQFDLTSKEKKALREVINYYEDTVAVEYFSIAEVSEAVCAVITVGDLAIVSRKANVVLARTVCSYFLYKHSKLSLEGIADFFGGQDHTTIIHNLGKIRKEPSKYGSVIQTVYNKLRENKKTQP